ncbi:MAG: hypothetical protein V4508_12915 [Pseudomonadota bacterium]
MRNTLDKRAPFTKGQRAKVYQRCCVYASHPTYAGVLLVAPKASGLATFGPFLDEPTLGHLLVDLAKFVLHGTLAIGRHFDDCAAPEIINTIALFHTLVQVWSTRHLTNLSAP